MLASLVYNAQSAVSIPTDKGDNGRSGLTPSETALTLQTVNSNSFGLLFEKPVTGDIYPQPLIVSGLTIGGGTHNVVFVCTAANNVYAFDADSAAVTNAYWSVNLGTPVPQADVQCSATDIATLIGIIGTPAIDTTAQTMYVVAKVKNPDATYHQWLHALSITTGAEKSGSPVEITGAGFDPKLNNQRPALLLQNGVVYIGWSSHNDCGTYHGIVFGYNATTLAQVSAWNDTPTGTKGGIWMSGGGLVGDGANIYLATGNGDFNASTGGKNYGESIVGFNSALSVLTYFTPSNWRSLNGHDVDLGGCPVLLIPGTRLIVTGGKDGNLYLVNADNMGGLAGGLQHFSVSSSECKGGLVAFTNSPAGTLVYIQGSGSSLKAYRMTNGVFSTTAFWTSSIAPPQGVPGGQLWFSGIGTNAILWETIPFSANAEHSSVPGILRAYNPTTGAEIYDSYQNKARDDFGNFAKNPAPVVANGKVYVATFSGHLAVYGMGPP
jgi:hypothetical protein